MSNAESLYLREYNSWKDQIAQATQMVNLMNSDAWNTKNFDEGVRQYEKSFAEQQRQYNESLAEQKRQHNEQMSYNWASLNKKSSGSSGSGGSGGNGYDYSAEDMEKASKSEATKTFKSSILTPNEFKRRGSSATSNGKSVRYDTYNEYIDAKLEEWYSDGKLTNNEVAYLTGYYFR